MLKAAPEGVSDRKMVRELGMHGYTVRRYIDAECPPTRGLPATSPMAHFTAAKYMASARRPATGGREETC